MFFFFFFFLFVFVFLLKPRFYYISAGLMRSASHGDVSMMYYVFHKSVHWQSKRFNVKCLQCGPLLTIIFLKKKTFKVKVYVCCILSMVLQKQLLIEVEKLIIKFGWCFRWLLLLISAIIADYCCKILHCLFSLLIAEAENPRWSVERSRNEPRHDKTCFSHMRTIKAQISLRIRAVWSETLLLATWIVWNL